MPALDAVASEVREWFDAYIDAFRRVAAEGADPEALLGYYGVPLVIATDAECAALPDRDAVLGMVRAVTDHLRQAGYASSAVLRLDVRPLNTRAAFLEGEFSRHDRGGAEFERVGVAFLAAKTDDGWRFAAGIVTGH